MQSALEQAQYALEAGEIPVGAVVVHHRQIIARGYNQRERLHSVLAHAELLAIQQACEKLGNWRLPECDLYVTLEPCAMCAGAIFQARFKTVYFGAYSRQGGCMGTVVDLSATALNTHTCVYGGIMEDACTQLMQRFFACNSRGRY